MQRKNSRVVGHHLVLTVALLPLKPEFQETTFIGYKMSVWSES